MDIKMINRRRKQVFPGVEQSYPAGWQGDIGDDDLALSWIESGDAHIVGAGNSIIFSDIERAVLKVAANEIIAANLEDQDDDETLDELDLEGLLEVAEIAGLEVESDISADDLRVQLKALANEAADESKIVEAENNDEANNPVDAGGDPAEPKKGAK